MPSSVLNFEASDAALASVFQWERLSSARIRFSSCSVFSVSGLLFSLFGYGLLYEQTYLRLYPGKAAELARRYCGFCSC
jgi:hypothetical protein